MTGRNPSELGASLQAKAKQADRGNAAPPFQSLQELGNETFFATADAVEASEAGERVRDKAVKAGRTPAKADAAAKAEAARVRAGDGDVEPRPPGFFMGLADAQLLLKRQRDLMPSSGKS